MTTRTIRPVGPVPAALKRHGYRQMAHIYMGDKQVPNVVILSLKFEGRLKFEGHFIDANGELHKTKPVFDVKRAANRLMSLRDLVMNELGIVEAAKPAAKPTVKPAAKPVAKPDAKQQRAARRAKPKPPASTDAARMCKKGCGFLHLDDTPCV
jgi:hypothetical protein